jgi:hypothetical protein
VVPSFISKDSPAQLEGTYSADSQQSGKSTGTADTTDSGSSDTQYYGSYACCTEGGEPRNSFEVDDEDSLDEHLAAIRMLLWFLVDTLQEIRDLECKVTSREIMSSLCGHEATMDLLQALHDVESTLGFPSGNFYCL